MHAVIFTGGSLRPSLLVNRVLASADVVIAADSGAETAIAFKAFPEVVIGDFDSLDAAVKDSLAAKGAQFITHVPDKEQTDTELAVDYAISRHATAITVLGGIEGDRIDHILANIFSVIDSKPPIRFVNGPTMAWSVRGPANVVISGSAGDTLSLLPLTARVAGIRTSGLKYRLHDEALYMDRARGVSNVMTRTKARVTLEKGVLLLVHSEVRQV